MVHEDTCQIRLCPICNPNERAKAVIQRAERDWKKKPGFKEALEEAKAKNWKRINENRVSCTLCETRIITKPNEGWYKRQFNGKSIILCEDCMTGGEWIQYNKKGWKIQRISKMDTTTSIEKYIMNKTKHIYVPRAILNDDDRKEVPSKIIKVMKEENYSEFGINIVKSDYEHNGITFDKNGNVENRNNKRRYGRPVIMKNKEGKRTKTTEIAKDVSIEKIALQPNTPKNTKITLKNTTNTRARQNEDAQTETRN